METEEAVDQTPGDASSSDPEEAIDEVDALLDEVEGALGRLDDGTYGTCRVCAGAIEDSRLSELPTALECAACVASGAEEPVVATPEAPNVPETTDSSVSPDVAVSPDVSEG
jgi:RNA polymerase-binding transcription factor DksA